MSETQTNPFESMFKMQRNSIEQSHRLIQQGIQMQQHVMRAYLNSVDAQQSAQKQGTQMVHSGIDVYFDVMAASLPGDKTSLEEARRALHEQFDAVDSVNDQTWAAIKQNLEAATEASDEFTRSYLEFVDDSFDAVMESQEQLGDVASSATQPVESD